MSAIVLQFENVVKSFRHFASPLHRLRAVFWPFGSRHTAIPVLEDVSFSVTRGESVAIIGANGVGKSTLLHLVAGLLEPSSGRITVQGRVAALLDLGGSFLPELTGRENARFYHRVVSRHGGDPLERERAIEEFAQLGEFFDRPVRTYSAGMFLRLAFACATVEEPDLILIDEVMAVGDARFQQKCYRRLAELRARGTTILLVTHVMHALTTIADRVLVLEHGRIVYDGEPGAGVDRYYQFLLSSPHESGEGAGGELRYGAGGATISRVASYGEGPDNVTAFRAGDTARVVFDVDFDRDVERPDFGFTCSSKEGTRIYTTSTSLLGVAPVAAAAGERRTVEVLFRLDTGTTEIFVDLSVFEVADGVMTVLDARVHVLLLSVTLPSRYFGVTDMSAVMRFMQ